MAKETTYEEIARDLKNRVYKPVYYRGRKGIQSDRSLWFGDGCCDDYQCGQALSHDVRIPGNHRKGSSECKENGRTFLLFEEAFDVYNPGDLS